MTDHTNPPRRENGRGQKLQRITVFLERAAYLGTAAAAKEAGKSMTAWVAELVGHALTHQALARGAKRKSA